MTVNIVWDNLYSARTVPITSTIAKRCIEILQMTGNVHRDRDFDGVSAQQVATKINSVDNGYNWLKVRTGHDKDSGAQVVIFYQLLRHRIRQSGGDPKYGYWLSAVGFDPALLLMSDIGKDVNDPANPYVQAAISIASQMHADLGGFEAVGDLSGDVSVIYDDIDAVDPIGKDPALRRTTRIGEIGWIAQSNKAIQNVFAIDLPTGITPHPTDDKGNPIPGWGRTLTEGIVVTKLTRR